MATCERPPYPAPPDPDTYYKRPLPENLPALDSKEGQILFGEALKVGTMAGYFKLASQFHTQADPTYCGLGSLVCGLNALEIDPQRRWKGAWRWFSEDLLDCCKSLEQVRLSGVTLDDVACLARCNDAKAEIFRPPDADISIFRSHVAEATKGEDFVLIVNYSRTGVGQTGGGHFSPIGGYHHESERLLILDTARFKYPPHWMPIDLLYSAMVELDPDTEISRGWLLLRRL